MRVFSRLFSGVVCLVAVVIITPCVAETGIPADKLKALQDVGKKVVAHSVEPSGLSLSDRKQAISSLREIRAYFMSQYLIKSGTDLAVRGKGNMTISQLRLFSPADSAAQLSLMDKVAEAGISIFYDDEHADRYRQRRAVFRAVDELGELGKAVKPAAWWEIWRQSGEGALAVAQSDAIGKLVDELEERLDFRQDISVDEAAVWIKRLTLSPAKADDDPHVPMFVMNIPPVLNVEGK